MLRIEQATYVIGQHQPENEYSVHVTITAFSWSILGSFLSFRHEQVERYNWWYCV